MSTDPSYLLNMCSNEGRWGDDDEKGTLNYIEPGSTRRALSTVIDGDVFSLAFDLPTRTSRQIRSASLSVYSTSEERRDLVDTLVLSVHGSDITHLDAVGHSVLGGKAYNGRRTEDIVGADGLCFGAITAMAQGVVTRGLLLDVAETYGVAALGFRHPVTVADLERTEAASAVRAERGDAIFVRTGQQTLGQLDPAERAGLVPEVVRWIHEREIAVYSGDCIELVDEGREAIPMPLHQIGHAGMGLAILDNPDIEALRMACERHGRSSFLFVAAPLRVPGGTGSAVNPLAIF